MFDLVDGANFKIGGAGEPAPRLLKRKAAPGYSEKLVAKLLLKPKKVALFRLVRFANGQSFDLAAN